MKSKKAVSLFILNTLVLSQSLQAQTREEKIKNYMNAYQGNYSAENIEQIKKDAAAHGVSASEIDTVMGFSAGTAQNAFNNSMPAAAPVVAPVASVTIPSHSVAADPAPSITERDEKIKNYMDKYQGNYTAENIEQIKKDAAVYGVSANEVDKIMGFAAGTTEAAFNDPQAAGKAFKLGQQKNTTQETSNTVTVSENKYPPENNEQVKCQQTKGGCPQLASNALNDWYYKNAPESSKYTDYQKYLDDVKAFMDKNTKSGEIQRQYEMAFGKYGASDYTAAGKKTFDIYGMDAVKTANGYSLAVTSAEAKNGLTLQTGLPLGIAIALRAIDEKNYFANREYLDPKKYSTFDSYVEAVKEYNDKVAIERDERNLKYGLSAGLSGVGATNKALIEDPYTIQSLKLSYFGSEFNSGGMHFFSDRPYEADSKYLQAYDENYSNSAGVPNANTFVEVNIKLVTSNQSPDVYWNDVQAKAQAVAQAKLETISKTGGNKNIKGNENSPLKIVSNFATCDFDLAGDVQIQTGATNKQARTAKIIAAEKSLTDKCKTAMKDDAMGIAAAEVLTEWSTEMAQMNEGQSFDFFKELAKNGLKLQSAEINSGVVKAAKGMQESLINADILYTLAGKYSKYHSKLLEASTKGSTSKFTKTKKQIELEKRVEKFNSGIGLVNTSNKKVLERAFSKINFNNKKSDLNEKQLSALAKLKLNPEKIDAAIASQDKQKLNNGFMLAGLKPAQSVAMTPALKADAAKKEAAFEKVGRSPASAEVEEAMVAQATNTMGEGSNEALNDYIGVVESDKRYKESLKPADEDTLFKRVNKAYIRNYKKLK